MIRIIPKSSKVKNNFFKSLSFSDIAIILLGLTLTLAVLFSNLHYRYIILMVVLAVFTTLLVNFDEERGYKIMIASLSYIFGKKRFKGDKKISELQSILKIYNNVLFAKNSVSTVLEIEPVAFSLLDEHEQDRLIMQLSSVLSTITELESCEIHIVKLTRPMTFDEYLFKNSVERSYSLNLQYESGLITKDEFDSRIEILSSNEELFEDFNENEVPQEHYYLQLFYHLPKHVNEELGSNFVSDTIVNISTDLKNNGLKNTILNNEELGIFVKNSYTPYFDERELYDSDDGLIAKNGYTKIKIQENLMPKSVSVKYNRILQDDVTISYLTATDYPLQVSNGWGFNAFHIPSSRATLKLKIRDRQKAIKDIDRSIMALKMYYLEHHKDSEQNEAEMHVSTLRELLLRLQNGNDHLFDVNFHVSVYDDKKNLPNKKNAKKILNGSEIRSALNFGKTLNCFLSDSLSTVNCGKSVGINSSSIAASFPFVSFGISDKAGVFIGESAGKPCMLDMFYRDNKSRVNSNAFVVGQSGMGKTYFTKTLLSQLLPNSTKVICFDPEQEYSEFARNVGGVSIDVATSSGGRINPFEIICELEEDAELSENNTFFSHLIFLESFFKTIIPSINEDSFEYLNTIVVEMYEKTGITAKSDFNNMLSENYPIFEDLFVKIAEKLEIATTEYDLSILRTLKNHISKFATGGRYSGLWNGKTTMKMDSSFVNFDFRQLLVTENKTLANAQMLLILRYCNLEVIKNKELNERGVDRKIVIVIDEAHVFFNSQFVVALNFMEQMARRIRKYYGMVMFTTQNIGDFLSSAAVAEKTKAIINACQYSFVFGLPANAVNDLIELYRSTKPLNENEIEYVKNASQGEVFAIISSNNRVGLTVVAPRYVQELFGEIKSEEVLEENASNEVEENGELSDICNNTINEKEEEDTKNT